MAREPSVSRRRWLATSGTALAAGLAGCTGGDDGDGSDDAGEGSDGSGDGAGGGDDDGGSTDAGSVSATGDWPMRRFDAAETSYAADRDGLGAPLGELWSYDELSSENVMVAVVRDGAVYSQTSGGECIALDATDGQERWRRTLDSGGGHRTPFGPAAAAEAIYAGGDAVYALDPESGDTIWEAPDVSARERLVFDDDLVYAPGLDGLSALDPATGEEQWLGETGDFVTNVSVGSEGRAYVCDADTVVSAFDTATGEELWTYDVEGSVYAGLASADGFLYACDPQESTLLCLSGETGDEEWQTETACEYHPSVTEDAVYVYSSSAARAFDPATGDELSDWEASLETSMLMTPTIAGSRGYALGGSFSDGVDSIVTFDAESGATDWEESVDYPGIITVAILEDVIVFGTEEELVALA